MTGCTIVVTQVVHTWEATKEQLQLTETNTKFGQDHVQELLNGVTLHLLKSSVSVKLVANVVQSAFQNTSVNGLN